MPAALGEKRKRFSDTSSRRCRGAAFVFDFPHARDRSKKCNPAAKSDKTGLDGLYDFTLAFIPPGGLYGLPPGVEKPDYPDIFHAVKEQLGLKLESQKGEVEMFVIDHIEKPTPN